MNKEMEEVNRVDRGKKQRCEMNANVVKRLIWYRLR